jgi:hypothetical protein
MELDCCRWISDRRVGRLAMKGPWRRAGLVAASLALAVVILPRAGAAPGDVITEVTLQVERTKGQRISPERLKAALSARLPLLRTTRSPSDEEGPPGWVTIDGAGLVHAHVREPSLSAAELEWLTRPGLLEVVWLPEVQSPTRPTARYAFTAYGIQGTLALRFLDTQTNRLVGDDVIAAQATPLVTGAELDTNGASLHPSRGLPEVELKFGSAGARRLAQFARRHVGTILGVLLDGHLISIPFPVSPRGQEVSGKGKATRTPTALEEGRVEFTAAFRSPAERENFVHLVNSGGLPRLKVIGQRTYVEGAPSGC